MRKILLATTALIGVAFAGAAQAAAPASPISLNVGGYDDFVAGYQSGGASVSPATGADNKQRHADFEDEFKIAFDALGKASNGVEYGANISLWNGAEATDSTPWSGGGSGLDVNSAYVWLSGAFGKVLFGDEHGASDLFVYAPTVGEGQIDGRYHDFVSSTHIAFFMPSGFDNTEHSTKVTYYTPKVGNDMNKVQLGVSYAPELYNYGQSIVKTQGPLTTNSLNGTSPDQDIIKGVLQYTGNFKPVNVTASGEFIHGGASHTPLDTTTFGAGLAGVTGATGDTHDFNSWGFGTQVAFDGVTLGGGYTNLGDYNTVEGQSKNQSSFNLGAKYEFDKVGVAASWINGRGYDNILTAPGTGDTTIANGTNYVKSFNAYGAGATYTWFPGLTSNIDGVLYDQKVDDAAPDSGKYGGYTVLVSQRLAF